MVQDHRQQPQLKHVQRRVQDTPKPSLPPQAYIDKTHTFNIIARQPHSSFSCTTTLHLKPNTSTTMPISPAQNLFVYTPPTPWQRFTHSPLLTITKWLYTHQPPISAPTRRKNSIKIVCISDTHTAQPTLPHGDVLVHAGDLTINGTFVEMQRQISWLDGVPHAHKIVIAGNHDLLLDTACYAHHANLFNEVGSEKTEKKRRRRQDLNWGSITYLQDCSAAICVRGRIVRVFGAPRTPRYGNWAFQYAKTRAGDVWTGVVPEGTDVLVTHGPAKGHLDRDGAGCQALLQELWRVRSKVHVCGHIHVGRGVEVLDWGWLQWCYDRMCIEDGGALMRMGNLIAAIVAWVCVWLRYLVLGVRREGRSTIINAAWEGNEEKGVIVIEV